MLLRQWQLVRALHGRRRGVRPVELHRAVGTTRQTLYRDLKILRDAGVPIATERVNGEARYSLLGTPLPPLAPDALELAALRLARRMLAPLEGTELVAALDRLLERFDARCGGNAGVATQPADEPPDAQRTIVQAADRALRANRRLRFDYRDAQGRRTTERTVDPVALRHVDGHLYLVAWDLERDDWRVFKVPRMRRAQVLDEQAGAHPDYDEDALFGGSVKTWHGEPTDVAVRLAPEVAWKANEWPLVPEQRLEPRSDGSVVVRARVQGVVEASRWVLSWGGAAEALAPPALRAAVRDQLAEALERYARPVAAAGLARAGGRSEAARVEAAGRDGGSGGRLDG